MWWDYFFIVNYQYFKLVISWFLFFEMNFYLLNICILIEICFELVLHCICRLITFFEIYDDISYKIILGILFLWREYIVLVEKILLGIILLLVKSLNLIWITYKGFIKWIMCNLSFTSIVCDRQIAEIFLMSFTVKFIY